MSLVQSFGSKDNEQFPSATPLTIIIMLCDSQAVWYYNSLASHTLRMREEGSGHAATTELSLRNAIIEHSSSVIRC